MNRSLFDFDMSLKNVRTLVVVLLSTYLSFTYGQPVDTYESKSRIPDLINLFNDGGASGYNFIVAHRGDWRNAPENSIAAYQICIDAGFDAIEIDVQETKDGNLAIIHDLTLERTTNGKGNVAAYTMDELKSFKLKTGHGYPTTEIIPSIDDVFGLLQGKTLIFVDKWRPVIGKVISKAKEFDCLDQLVVWENISDIRDFEKKYTPDLSGLSYMPVLTLEKFGDSEEFEGLLNEFPKEIGVIGIKFSSSDLIKVDDFGSAARRQGKRMMVFMQDPRICGGRGDDLAVNDIESSYQWLLDRGISIFFSDRPFLLRQYFDKEANIESNKE